MRLPALLLALAVAVPARAKPWNGITPGASTKAEVLAKFGEPTKKVDQADGKKLWAYTGDQAIKGSRQAQFILTAEGHVEQIVVFPAVAIDKPTVEESFGPPCTPPGGAAAPVPVSAANCYVRQLADDYRTYFWYKRLGVVIFFTEDGKSVYSILYQAPGAGEKKAP